jgi:fluoride ion exporter CrcB/FEX
MSNTNVNWQYSLVINTLVSFAEVSMDRKKSFYEFVIVGILGGYDINSSEKYYVVNYFWKNPNQIRPDIMF